LFIAAQAGKLELVRLLVEKLGADVTKETRLAPRPCSWQLKWDT
jgi:hypothetical protein